MKDLYLTKYFPGTSEAKVDVIHLLVVIAVYLLANWLVAIVRVVIRVYLSVGVLVALLAFLKMVK